MDRYEALMKQMVASDCAVGCECGSGWPDDACEDCEDERRQHATDRAYSSCTTAAQAAILFRFRVNTVVFEEAQNAR